MICNDRPYIILDRMSTLDLREDNTSNCVRTGKTTSKPGHINIKTPGLFLISEILVITADAR